MKKVRRNTLAPVAEAVMAIEGWDAKGLPTKGLASAKGSPKTSSPKSLAPPKAGENATGPAGQRGSLVSSVAPSDQPSSKRRSKSVFHRKQSTAPPLAGGNVRLYTLLCSLPFSPPKAFIGAGPWDGGRDGGGTNVSAPAEPVRPTCGCSPWDSAGGGFCPSGSGRSHRSYGPAKAAE